MISHLIFFLIAALYYAVKLLRRAVFGDRRARVSSAGEALETLVAQHGGAIRRTGPASYECVLPDGTQVSVRRRRHVVLTVKVPLPAGYSITFQRLPRLAYAFLEAFLPDALRMGNHPYLVTTTASLGDAAQLRKRPDFLRLFDELGSHGYSMHLDSSGLRAWKRMRPADTNDVALANQIRCLRDFTRACRLMPDIPVHPVQSLPRCAFCREAIAIEMPATLCASCGTPHHQECFELNGKCTVFGCNSIRVAEAVLAR